jgi:hypothetical protein
MILLWIKDLLVKIVVRLLISARLALRRFMGAKISLEFAQWSIDHFQFWCFESNKKP